MKTIFEKIIDREIPTEFIYEDEDCVAFLDAFPVAKGHTLIVSRQPYRWMTDVPEETIANMFVTAQKLMNAIKKATGCDYVRLNVVGEEVPHFHIHLIPQMIETTPVHTERILDNYANDTEQTDYVNEIKQSIF